MSRNINIRINYKKTVPVESKNKSYINMSKYIKPYKHIGLLFYESHKNYQKICNLINI
jgi:hypothetical protein